MSKKYLRICMDCSEHQVKILELEHKLKQARKGYVKLDDVLEIIKKQHSGKTSWTTAGMNCNKECVRFGIDSNVNYLVEQIKELDKQEYNSRSEMRRLEHMKEMEG